MLMISWQDLLLKYMLMVFKYLGWRTHMFEVLVRGHADGYLGI